MAKKERNDRPPDLLQQLARMYRAWRGLSTAHKDELRAMKTLPELVKWPQWAEATKLRGRPKKEKKTTAKKAAAA